MAKATFKTAAILLDAALATTSAFAQVPAHNQTGQTTETRERPAHRDNNDLIWNLIGCLGLIGLLGLKGRVTPTIRFDV